jgi:hypothetical protein
MDAGSPPHLVQLRYRLAFTSVQATLPVTDDGSLVVAAVRPYGQGMKLRTATGRREIAFTAFAAMMLVVDWALTRSSAFTRGGAVPVAMFVDCVVVLPVAFFLLVLHPRGRPVLHVVPVLAAGGLLAGLLLSGRPETRMLLRVGGGFVELAVVVALIRRVPNGKRELRAADSDDLLLRMSALTDPVLRAVGLELAVFYYAVVGPGVRRPLRAGEFSYVAKSGVGGLLFAFGLLIAVEGTAVHFILHIASALVVWTHAAADVYALVWLVAAFQAARLRPVVVARDRLLVRTSLLWTADVPRTAIASVSRIREKPRAAKHILNAAFGAPAELLVRLREPVVARGLLGMTKTVTSLAMYVDEPEALHAALIEPLGM